MLGNYLPILIFLTITSVMGTVFIVLGKLLGPSRPDAEKNSPYECGFEAFEDSRMKFDVRYYLVAILFIIFDLEIAFLFPWAIVLDQIGNFGLFAMGIFLIYNAYRFNKKPLIIGGIIWIGAILILVFGVTQIIEWNNTSESLEAISRHFYWYKVVPEIYHDICWSILYILSLLSN